MGQCATHTFIITQSDIPKTRMTNSPRDINEKSDNTGISDISELMGGYIDGQLSAEEKLRAETALQTDVTAAKVLAELQSLRTGIKALGGETEQRSSMAEKILAQLNAPEVSTSTPKVNPRPTISTVPARSSRFSFYISIVAIVVAAVAIWQVFQGQQDEQGNPLVDVIEDETQVSPNDGERVVSPDRPNQQDQQDQGLDPGSGIDQPQLVENSVDGDSGKPNPEDMPPATPVVPSPMNPSELVNNKDPGGELAGVQPDLSLLTGGKFLFVIEIGVTPEGVEADVVREVLMKNGIVYDGGLDVMPELESQLLKSRYLNGVVQKDEQPVGGTVDLIYMVASGLQIDQTRLDIHARHEHIARYRFNMALLPKDVGVFDNLHRTVKSQWATDEPEPEPSPKLEEKAAYQQHLRQWQGKASRLMTTLYFLAGKGAAVSKVGIEIPPTQKTPKGANRGDLAKPGSTEKPILGADLICEVLLVVRNMTQAEVERLPDPKAEK